MAGPSPAGRAGQATQTTHGSGGTAQARFHAEFACVQCADDVTRALAASPHITAFHVDYPRHEVAVTYHVGVINPGEIQAMISGAAHGCRCVADRGPSDTAERAKPSGGDLAALGHGADMAAITQGTTADRMQYEFPYTSGAHLHDAAHRGPITGAAPPPMGHRGHGNHVMAGPAPGVMDQSDNGAMGHDMSDPQMARAMEHDMRTRFFGALILAVPTLLFSPVAMTTFGLRLVPLGTANWLMLLFSTPVVWWAGWPFIGGAATSLRHRALNMSVLIAVGVLAAWGLPLGAVAGDGCLQRWRLHEVGGKRGANCRWPFSNRLFPNRAGGRVAG